MKPSSCWFEWQVEQYESRCDTYLNLVGWLIGQSNAMPPKEQADLCLHLADLICARLVRDYSHLVILASFAKFDRSTRVSCEDAFLFLYFWQSVLLCWPYGYKS